MPQSFIYDRPVTGKDFYGRISECEDFAARLGRFENIAVSGTPKSGKSSMVRQAFRLLDKSMGECNVVDVDLLSVRTLEQFCKVFGETILRFFANTPEEYSDLISKYAGDGGVLFDSLNFASEDDIMTFSTAPDLKTVRQILFMPFGLADECGKPLFVCLKHFQNVLSFDDCDGFLRCLANCLMDFRSEAGEPACSFVFIGSGLNAMKEIFERRHFLGKCVSTVYLSAVDQSCAIPEISRRMLTSGKVIDQKSALSVYEFFKGDVYYINRFCAICDFLSRGYIQEPVLQEALSLLLGACEPFFKYMVSDLTGYQISMLEVLVDGNVRPGSADVIRKYGLNSSANVKRLKDALMKKEIIFFDKQDVPHFQDPLFEYWLANRYFKKNIHTFL